MGQFGSKHGEYSRIKACSRVLKIVWGINRDADEIRLSKAYKMIAHIANSLNLPNFIVEVSLFLSGFAAVVQVGTI